MQLHSQLKKASQQVRSERADSLFMGSVIMVPLTLFVTSNLGHLVCLGATSVFLILCSGDRRLGKHLIYPNYFEKDIL